MLTLGYTMNNFEFPLKKFFFQFEFNRLEFTQFGEIRGITYE